VSITLVRSEIRSSSIDGKGLFSNMHLSPGTVVGFFDGVVKPFPIKGIIAEIPDSLNEQAIDLGVVDDCLFALVPNGKLSGVDFINHSCHPNCYVEGFLKIVVSSPIEPGDELTIDYAPLTLVKEGKSCNCSPGCTFVL